MGKKVTQNKMQAALVEKRNRKSRLIVGLVLIVVALAGIGTGVWLFLREQKQDEAAPDTSSYEEVLKTYYNAILSCDGQSMSQITAPPEYWVYYLEEYDKTEEEVVATFEESCQDLLEEWKETYGSDVAVSYQIVGMSNPAQEGLDEWNSDMEELLGNDSASISEAVTLEVEEHLSGSTDSGTETVYPTLAKMGDSWYILEADSEELQGDTSSES